MVSLASFREGSARKTKHFPPMGSENPSCKTHSYEFYIKLDTDRCKHTLFQLSRLYFVAWSSNQLCGNEIFTRPNWEHQRWKLDDTSWRRLYSVSALCIMSEMGWNRRSARTAGILDPGQGSSARPLLAPDYISGLFLGHSSQRMWRGHLKFYLQTAVDFWRLLPHSNMAMHLHSRHSAMFVLKD